MAFNAGAIVAHLKLNAKQFKATLKTSETRVKVETEKLPAKFIDSIRDDNVVGLVMYFFGDSLFVINLPFSISISSSSFAPYLFN